MLTSLLTEWSASETDDAQSYADALLRGCAGLSDEALRALPATPDDAAASLVAESPLLSSEGVYLAWAWLEAFCASVGLPVAELEDGWDLSDGEAVYFCPRVDLGDSEDDLRPFVRVDQIRRWPDR